MADKKKIIIVYSTAGLGHKKAAMAILDAFRNKCGDTVDLKIIDLLEYASPFYRFLYTTFYIFVITHARWFWSMLYYFSNNPVVDMLIRKMRSRSDSRNLRRLELMFAEEDPDAIVATHFLVSGVAESLKRVRDLRSRIYVLVTDYGPHSYWLSDWVDRFFVGADPVSRELAKRGIPPEKITATGIPTSEDFSRDFDREQVREKYGLDRTRSTIFLMSGGFGTGPIEKILLSLNSCNANIQVITVCGHNKAVYEDVKSLKEKLTYPLVLLGFTDKVAELMSASDLMITKAGGISVTEALNRRLPMILYASVPGQETWNEKFLTGCAAAEKAEKVEDIPLIADRILLSDESNAAIKANIKCVRKPDAADRVVDIVMEEIGG